MAAMHQTSNPLLKDLRAHIFTEYCVYLLGKDVWSLAAVSSDGRQMAHPTWTLLSQYEHEMRAQACSLMETRGVRLDDAFRQAWCDQTTRDRYFLTPLALEHRKRPEPTGSDDHNKSPQLSKKQRKAEKKKEQCVSTLTRRIWYAAVVEVALLPTCAGVASKWARQ